ncbi:MAG TPA: alpha/beta hydrolase, partial [Candidatus Brocadiia bacterium]|nr:alpha/beta hydrolase [Candidatus Brocadiia bacterium]
MTEPIRLWPADAPGCDPSLCPEPPVLVPYLVQSGKPRGLVIVCPGGGYSHRAAHEGEPVAQRFNKAGIHAAVVHYRVSPCRHPAPLLDAQRAIRLVRHNAAEWNVLPDHVAILGFSAGGHLASSAAVHFDAGAPASPDPIERHSSRPNAAVLCYPVISFVNYFHAGSVRNLLGE